MYGAHRPGVSIISDCVLLRAALVVHGPFVKPKKTGRIHCLVFSQHLIVADALDIPYKY